MHVYIPTHVVLKVDRYLKKHFKRSFIEGSTINHSKNFYGFILFYVLKGNAFNVPLVLNAVARMFHILLFIDNSISNHSLYALSFDR